MGLISTADSTINSIALVQQSANPPTIATRWQVYVKSGGLYIEDESGTVSKVSTGGGGVDFGLTSTATAAGTTTLTNASNPIQSFTGATTQNCVLPDATTLAIGWLFVIRNTSSGIVTVKDGGAGATIVALAANQEVTLYCTSIGSAAGAWSQQVVTGTGSVVLATSPTLAGTVTVTGDVKLNTAGNGLYVKEGSNASMGVASMTGGTVTVSTTKVTANSRIFLTIQTAGGTLGAVYVSARSAGTSFTISSLSVLDTSSVAWLIVEPA